MKLTLDALIRGAVNIAKTTHGDIDEFIESTDMHVKFHVDDTKADRINKIVDALEEGTALEDLTPKKPEPVKTGEPQKRGMWGLGYRENGEHICPTHDGSPDKGTNALNTGHT
jgi:hypothetical protein